MLGTAYYNVTAGQLDTEAEVMIQILLGIVGTFLVFWSVSGALFQIMKKCSGIYYKRLNSFAFSEIRSQVNTSVAAGTIICLLLFATICILSSAFALKDYKAKQVKKVAGISVSMENGQRMEKRSGMYWKNQNLIFLPSRTAMNFILMKPEKLP